MNEKETFRKAIEAHVLDQDRIQLQVLRSASSKTQHAVRFPRKKWMIAVFAAVLLFASTAVASVIWMTRENYSVERYLLQSEEERTGETGIKDIEKMIEDASIKDLGYTITLMNDLPDAERYEDFRKELGAKPFDPNEWAWLQEITPRTADVIVDGKELIVQTRLYTPHAKSFYTETADGIKLDALGEDGYFQEERDPAMTMLFCDSWGVPPMASTPEYALSFTSYSMDDVFPKEGLVTVCQRIHILDSNVDDMSINATVAVIEHRLSFRSEAMQDVADATISELALKGNAVLTCRDPVSCIIQNHTVDLDGVNLNATLNYRKTGLAVKFTLSESGTLSDTERASFLESAHIDLHGNYDNGLILRYTVGKDTYTAPISMNTQNAFLIPVFPSEYGTVQSIHFSLSLAHLTKINGAELGNSVFDWTESIETQEADETPIASWSVTLPKV